MPVGHSLAVCWPIVVCIRAIYVGYLSDQSIFCFLSSVYTPFHEDGNISQARKAGEAIANAFIVIGVVLVLTIVLVLLYKFRCYCVSIIILSSHAYNYSEVLF